MKQRGIAGGVLVAVMLVIGLAPRGGAAEDAGIRVAVMEFTNAAPSGELDSLGKGLQAMVTTDLAEVPGVQLLERARLADVVGELKLGKTGLIDAGTASRIGKLAGATHLLTGSFTVVGTHMRLDGRLFAVESGATVLADSAEGEKDAFFELEKALVGKLVGKLGVKLAPKERARLARPQTTDFDAFQSFSNGVALFDARKYDDAVAALRAAMSRDSEFKLASVTLAEYERVIAEVRGRADELQVSEQQLATLARQKVAHDEAEMLQRLFALAGRTGTDDATTIDRLAARRAIAEAYGNLDSDFHVLALQNAEDRFALQRTADAFTQSYYAEAVRRFPRFPVVIRGEPRFPKGLGEYDAWWKAQRDAFAGPAKIEDLQWWARMNLHRPVDFFARRLHLDARGEAELHAQLYQLAIKAGADLTFRTEALRRIAADWRRAGDFARSTQAFTELAGILHNADGVRKIADEIELDRKVTEALERSPQRRLLHEAFTLASGDGRALEGMLDRRDFLAMFAGAAPTPKALFQLAHLRGFPREGNNGAWRSERYVWIGDQPVWLLQQPDRATTFAPRTDLFRAAEIRYFVPVETEARRAERPDVDALLVVEGVPRGQVTMRFRVDFTPAADWWPPQIEAYDHTRSLAEVVQIDTRPEVGIVFALQDVDRVDDDPKTHARTVGAPLRGYLVTLDATGAHLSTIVPGTPSRWSVDTPSMTEPKRFARRPAGDAALDLRAARHLDVTAAIAGRSLRLTVNGKPLALTLPAAPPAGFYGLELHGTGYAAITNVKVTHP